MSNQSDEITRLRNMSPEFGKFSDDLLRMLLNWYRQKYDKTNNAYNNLISRKLRYDMPVSFIANEMDLKDKSLLDVGCGTGQNMPAFAEAGMDMFFGIDVNPFAIEIAKERMRCEGLKCRLFADDFLDYDFEEERFDVINCIGVLEHIYSRSRQIAAIKKMYYLLKEGGLMFFLVPNQLFWIDLHTTNLPFAHWLPSRLCKPYTKLFGMTPPTYIPMRYRHILRITRELNNAEIISKIDIYGSFKEFVKWRIKRRRRKDGAIVLYMILLYPLIGLVGAQALLPNLNVLIRKNDKFP